MNNLVACPHCRQQVGNDGSLSGQVVSCPHCRGQFTMPGIAARDMETAVATCRVQPIALASFPQETRTALHVWHGTRRGKCRKSFLDNESFGIAQ
jgi:uncharacterized protein YbaR (Trm112 family)